MRSAREFLDVADALRVTTDATKTLRVITDAAARMTVSTQATLRLHDPESGMLLLGNRTGDAMHTGGAGKFNGEPEQSALGWCVEHREALIIEDPENDPRFVVREGQTWMPSGVMAAPLLERDRVLGVVSVARPEGGWPYTQHDLDTLCLIAELAAPYIRIDRLTELAERDQLTGLFNRHHLEGLLPRLQGRAIRRADPVAGILLDLDHFGKINKKHGWGVGDLALQRAADVLREKVRVVDSVVRAGGEEFLILLPSTSAKEASPWPSASAASFAPPRSTQRRGTSRSPRVSARGPSIRATPMPRCSRDWVSPSRRPRTVDAIKRSGSK